jgi:glycosyltransferase involved in cell wall biosynthesis
LAQHYASADIFLFPSLSETFGNVTLEAAASGLAISAFDYAAASELIVHADNGLVAAIDKPQDFINNAIELATDAALRHKLRSNANASTQRMAWEAIVDQVQDVWLDLLRTPHTSPTQRVDTKTGFATAPQA